jgi:hypothetical protein
VPLGVGAISAGVAEILFKEFVWDEFIAPALRFQVNIAKRKAKMWIRNPSIQFTHSANISKLRDRQIKMDQIPVILESLRDNKVPARRLHDLGISFDNFAVGDLTYSGTLEFAADFNVRYIEGLTITLTTHVSYKSMQADITAITHFMNKLQNYVNQSLGIPLSYREDIACKLTKLRELTGILRGLKINYMSLGEDAQLSMSKDTVMFSEPIDYSKVVPKLKELVILFG